MSTYNPMAVLLDRAADLLASSSMHHLGRETIDELRREAQRLREPPPPRSAREAACRWWPQEQDR